MRALDNEFRRLYRKHVEIVEGELTLDEEEGLLIEGTLDGFEALYHALSGVEGVRQTDGRVDNLVACSLHLQAMVRAVASSEMLSSYFVEAVSTVSLASRRGFSPKEALAEFDEHLEVVTKKRENREAYLIKTAGEGRKGRHPKGRDIFVDGETTRTTRAATNAREAATRAGKRERRYAGPTMETHALAAKAAADDQKGYHRNRRRRIKAAQKAAGVATPKDCRPSHTLSDDGVPLFRTDSRLVPEGADNRPRIAEEAAARAVQHRAEKGKKTRAEIEADRRARLPDKVRASESASHAGQFTIQFCMNKSYPNAIRKKFEKNFSVVKPGTDGYYASKKAAAEVRDEWIKLKQPVNWMAKERY